MYKKTITYTDYNGKERTEDFYFNLTKAELMEINFGFSGGMEQSIRDIVDMQDGKKLMELFKEFILRSYGEKSPDGRRFIKSKEMAEEFSQTEAYSELFMELSSDDKAANEFLINTLPKDAVAKAEAAATQNLQVVEN